MGRKGNVILAAALAAVLSGCQLCEPATSGEAQEPAVSGAEKEQTEEGRIKERTEEWAEAFCARDGEAFYALLSEEQRRDFYDLPYVQSGPEDGFFAIGMSSPWPMDCLYTAETAGNRAVITYYAMTSEPHRYAWTQEVEWTRENGEWYGKQTGFSWNDQISSEEEFENAYGHGISGTPMDYRTGGEGWADVLAKEERLSDPGKAMEFLLNLHGGKCYVEDRGGQTALAVYFFAEGGRAGVVMERPEGENIWLPKDLASEEELPAELTAKEVSRLAGIAGAQELKERLSELPGLTLRKEEGEAGQALNRVDIYPFWTAGEAYELQASYRNGDGALDYVSLVSLETGERLNLYESEENLAHFGAELEDTLAGADEVLEFFSSRRGMGDFMSFTLPDGLREGEFDAGLGNGGGVLFIPEDEELKEKLASLFPHEGAEGAPEEWRQAGAVIRYTGGFPGTVIENGTLTQVELPWNHSSYASDPVFLADCEAPAMEILVEHDLYTAASLAEAEEKYGPVPEERQVSRMWHVFFAKEGSGTVYDLSLNAELFSQEDGGKLARSVHFTDGAWEEAGEEEACAPENGTACGFLRGFADGRVWIDFAEYVEEGDAERMKELGLTEADLAGGYCIYNPGETVCVLDVTPKTVYSFIDWGRDFVDSDDPEELRISTDDPELFRAYLETYEGGSPGMPFFWEIEDGAVARVEERPMA